MANLVVQYLFLRRKIPKFNFTTKSYDYLLSLIDNVGEDSIELYKTIQKYNPYAKKVKKDFLNKLKKLEDLSV